MRSRILVSAFLFLTLLSGCKGEKTSPSSTPTPSPLLTSANLTWLKTHAVPFDTSDPRAPLQDLSFLKDMVGDARIVALGEATTGTHEFIQMKQRLLEFLVEYLGFNTIVLGIGTPEAAGLDAYIHTGEGDALSLSKSWYEGNTQEFQETVEWMRAYNADPNHPRKISFYGYGMQSDQLAREAVTAFIQKVDSQAVAQIQDDYSCYLSTDTCMKKLQDAYDQLNVHESDFTAEASQAEFERALHCARIVIENAMISSQSNNEDQTYQYITENIRWIMDQAGPEAKVVLWDHNLVIWMATDGYSHSIGDYLRQHYGNQLVAFGVLFYRGSFNAVRYGGQNGIQVFHAAEPPGDSYEFFFQAAGLPRFFLDMRPARADASDQAWLFSPHSAYWVSWVYDRFNPPYYTVPLAKTFDVVIYFKDTTPSTLLNQ